MQINENLWNKFRYNYEPIQCNNLQEEKDFLCICEKRLNIKTSLQSISPPFPHIFIYYIRNNDLVLSFQDHNNFILFSKLYEYNTWEIIKLYQENKLNKNDIIIGKNIKERVCDLREENLGIKDLLINEPFIFQKRESNKDIENKKHIKTLLKDLTEAINKII
ncbi:TPA: hypothetical protein ACXDAZ_002501 [Clostridium botulinum]